MQRILSILSVGAALLTVTVASSAGSAGPAGPKQQILTKVVAEIGDIPGEYKPKPAVVLRALKAVQINKDGIADYQLDYGDLGIQGYCGTGGCRFQLWMGNATGAPKLAFDRMMRTFKTRNGPNGLIYDFDFHGGECGKSGADACPASFAYDARLKKLVSVPTPGRRRVARIFSPID